MLSEEEKREIKALAQSAQVREEFQRVKPFPRREPVHCTVDEYLAFLDVLRQVRIHQPPPRPFPLYTNIRL